VAGGHEVAGLPVGSVTDLMPCVSPNSKCSSVAYPIHIRNRHVQECEGRRGGPYLGHGSLALEPPADAVVNTLRLAP
jgi:hypothetical protein